MISKGYVARLALYIPVFLYLLGDVFVFKGPLSKKIDALKRVGVDSSYAENRGIVASVLGKSVLLNQVDWAVDEYLFRNGESRETLKPGKLKTLRLAMLNDLIDAELLRAKVHYNQKDYPIDAEEIDLAYAKKLRAFDSEEDYLKLLKDQGVENREEARTRIKAKLQQEKYLEYIIAPSLEISDGELKAFYDKHIESFKQPRRYRVRHIFLSTTDKASSQVEVVLDKIISDIEGGESFEEKARAVSEDERSKLRGGELGWVGDNSRNLSTLREKLKVMQLGDREKIRSHIGWHYVELLELKAPQVVSFTSAKREIRAALETKRREMAIKRYRQTLRWRQRPYIAVYTNVM